MDAESSWYKLLEGLCRMEGEVWREGSGLLLAAQPLSVQHSRAAGRDAEAAHLHGVPQQLPLAARPHRGGTQFQEVEGAPSIVQTLPTTDNVIIQDPSHFFKKIFLQLWDYFNRFIIVYAFIVQGRQLIWFMSLISFHLSPSNQVSPSCYWYIFILTWTLEAGLLYNHACSICLGR